MGCRDEFSAGICSSGGAGLQHGQPGGDPGGTVCGWRFQRIYHHHRTRRGSQQRRDAAHCRGRRQSGFQRDEQADPRSVQIHDRHDTQGHCSAHRHPAAERKENQACRRLPWRLT